MDKQERPMTPAEVARALNVDPRTVTRWARAEPPKIKSFKTPGGHRRYPRAEVVRILRGEPR